MSVLCAVLLLIIGGTSSGEDEDYASLDFEENLECRLKNIIGELTDSEKVRVMITTDTEQEGSGFSDKNATPKIKGAAVICDRKLSNEAEKEIISVVSKTLGIGSNHIFVGSSHIMN